MIIQDGVHHKLDVDITKDGWLQVSTFHRKAETEWIARTTRMSPTTVMALYGFIEKNQEKFEEAVRKFPDGTT